jgi:hypothetical protein
MSVILPGAQSLVNAILTDGWAQLRSKLASRWSKDAHSGQDDAEQRLEVGYSQSLALAGEGDERQARLEAYWAGYLAALLAERPGLLGAIRDLGSSAATDAGRANVHNTNTGTVGTLLQAGNLHGDITFGGRDR